MEIQLPAPELASDDRRCSGDDGRCSGGFGARGHLEGSVVLAVLLGGRRVAQHVVQVGKELVVVHVALLVVLRTKKGEGVNSLFIYLSISSQQVVQVGEELVVVGVALLVVLRTKGGKG